MLDISSKYLYTVTVIQAHQFNYAQAAHQHYHIFSPLKASTSTAHFVIGPDSKPNCHYSKNTYMLPLCISFANDKLYCHRRSGVNWFVNRVKLNSGN